MTETVDMIYLTIGELKVVHYGSNEKMAASYQNLQKLYNTFIVTKHSSFMIVID